MWHGRVLLHEDVIGIPVGFHTFESCRWLQLENCISTPSVIFLYLPFTEFQGRHWMKGIPGAFIFCLKYSFAINYLIWYLLHHCLLLTFSNLLWKKKKAWWKKHWWKACVETVSQLQVISRIQVHTSVSLEGESKFEQKDPALPVCIF